MNLILLPLGAIGQTWLALILYRRRLHKQFRFFFTYTVFAVAAAVVKFAGASTSYKTYFVTYWVTEAGYVVLGMLAILEVFPIVFKTFSLLWQFRLLIWGMAFFMIVVSLLQAVYAPPNHASAVVAFIYSFEVTVRYVEGGVFLLFVLLVRFWRIVWRQYAFGVVLGFGILAVGYLLPGAFVSEFKTKLTAAVSYVPAFGYIIAVVVWLLFFIRPEPPDPYEVLASDIKPEEVTMWVKRLTDSIKELWR